MGLVSDGGVHSGWEHIEACIELAAQEGVPDLVVHAFTDGRDTRRPAAPGTSGARALAAPRRQRRDGQRPLLRDGPRPPLGSDQARLRRDRPRRGPSRRPARGGGRGLLRAGRDRRVRAPDGDRRLRRDGRRRRRRSTSTSVPTGPGSCPGARRARVRRVRPRKAARDRAHDADRVPRGLGLPGGVPASRAERRRSPR